MSDGVRTMKHTALRRIMCVLIGAVLACASGCGNQGNPGDNTVQQTNELSGDAVVIERTFVGSDVNTPEYIEGVVLKSENGKKGIELKDYENASVYCYMLDRKFFSIEKPLVPNDIVKKYVNDLEKEYGVKFNKSTENGKDIYYSNLSTKSGKVNLAVCGSDFFEDDDTVVSVAIVLPEGGGSSGKSSAEDGDITGFWKCAYYLADNGNTIKADQYSIFAYNTGSASFYDANNEKFDGTWKAKDKGFEFTFVLKHGYGEMGKINGGDYLIVKFDDVDGQYAFEYIY